MHLNGVVTYRDRSMWLSIHTMLKYFTRCDIIVDVAWIWVACEPIQWIRDKVSYTDYPNQCVLLFGAMQLNSVLLRSSIFVGVSSIGYSGVRSLLT